jgi:hypothetical protein
MAIVNNLTDEVIEWIHEILIPVLKQKQVRRTATRKNSGFGRTECYGYGSRRGRPDSFFASNTHNPELFHLLLLLGDKIVPKTIPFTSIQLNHNYQTKPHVDKNNIGDSLTLSFGDFTGGELVVNGVPHQTRNKTLIFDGSLHEHYNKPIIGDRYSIVFFVNKFSKSNRRTALDVHNELISNIF